MNLSDVEQLQNYLSQSGLRPKDYLGQNFLVDEDALAAIIEAGDLHDDDTVLEVGPGLGVLTEQLVSRVAKLIAVEKDQRLVGILKHGVQKKFKTLEIINEDILRFKLDEHISGSYKVIANIPYYLTSHLFKYFLEQTNKPKLLVLMIQKEVGERVVASAGDLSVLGISVQIFADAEIIQHVPKTSFWPSPKVDSVILKITPRHKYPEIRDEKLFFRIVKIAFAGKRKQIHNTLSAGLKLPKDETFQLLKQAGIEPTTRPQDVKIEHWIALYQEIQKLNN